MPNTNYILTPEGNFISETELYHHGIKGMKWGVRRYQNADGSLTNAGKKRYWDKAPEGYSIAHQIKEDKMRHAIKKETDKTKKKQLKREYKELVELGKQKAKEYLEFENDMHKKVGKISKVKTKTDVNGHKTYTNKKGEKIEKFELEGARDYETRKETQFVKNVYRAKNFLVLASTAAVRRDYS